MAKFFWAARFFLTENQTYTSFTKYAARRLADITIPRPSATQCGPVSLRDQPSSLQIFRVRLSPKRAAAHGLYRRRACCRVILRSPNTCYSSYSPTRGCGTLAQSAKSLNLCSSITHHRIHPWLSTIPTTTNSHTKPVSTAIKTFPQTPWGDTRLTTQLQISHPNNSWGPYTEQK